MSRTVSDAIVQSFVVPSLEEKWTDLPFDKLHPFSKAVRLVIDSASHLADILDRNDEAEIAHELSPKRSCFLCNLKVLLKIEYSPDGDLLSIMPELKEQLLRLRASFTKRYRPDKSKFVVGEINRLIKEICDNPRFDNIYLQKDIYEYFCNFFLKLNRRHLPQPTHDENIVEMQCCTIALETMNANAEYADSLPSRNAALLEELKTRDPPAETIQGVDKHRAIYEYVRIKGKMVKVIRPELRARFTKNVHVMIRSTANLIEAITKNNAEEIDRNFRPNASPFLTDLHALLETACLPGLHAPPAMRTLRLCLRRLKVAFFEHFGAAKSNDVVNGIAKLVDAICDHPQYGNKTVFAELFGCFCRSFKSMNVSKPYESKLQTALESLKAIVEDACANSKDGAFLFTREDYVAVVNELWKHQTSPEYAVKRSEAATIGKLWYEIRTKLIEYAKSMIPEPIKTIRDLSHRDCWQLFPKFTTVNEEPHVLDSTTVKELYATLNIPEKPRRNINPKQPPEQTDNEVMANAPFYLRTNDLIYTNADLAGTSTTRRGSASEERIIAAIKTTKDEIIDKCGRPTYEFNDKDIFEDKFAAESYVCEVGKAIKKEKPELRGRFAVAEYIMKNVKRGEAFHKECLRIREVAKKHGWTKITTIRQKLQGQHRTKQSTVKRRTQIERKKKRVAKSLAPIRKSKSKNKGNGR